MERRKFVLGRKTKKKQIIMMIYCLKKFDAFARKDAAHKHHHIYIDDNWSNPQRNQLYVTIIQHKNTMEMFGTTW